MTPEDGQQLLGIDSSDPQAPQASEIIEQAYQTRRAGLQHKRDQAPTEAVQAKLDQALAKLEVARNTLLAASSVPEGSSGTSSQAPSRSSSLSGTKLADLPQADASHTGFDGGQAGAQLNLQAGTVLAGRYEIRERIGAGGMGAVYRALDKTTGKDIAVKVLLPGLMKNERARERFLDEARISQQLSHPNIVNVYDVQQDGDFFFLTMELLEGQDLRQVMDNRQLARQPFSQQEMQALAGQLCDALAYAHKHTVHRDLKPENVWLTEDGDYKLMDFGIARVQSTSQRTQTGAAMGTAYYMAPEQLKGQKNIDGRADQYALGVMLYELATGEVPAGLIKPLRELRKDLSRGFANTVMRTLHTNPDERFADVSAFGQSLQSGKGGAELQWPWKSLGIAAGVLVAVLGLGGLAVSGGFGLDGLKGLLPMSAEEIAQREAQLSRLQAEIRVLKQQLENSRRNLASDVRDAERNKSSNFAVLNHWQRLTENSIFSGSTIGELEGALSMAETLLRREQYDLAEVTLIEVKASYDDLNREFQAGERLFEAEQTAQRANSEWQEYIGKYSFPGDSPGAEQARQQYDAAQAKERSGALTSAFVLYQQAAGGWRAAKEEDAVVSWVDAQEAAWKAAEEKRRMAAAAEAAARQRAAEQAQRLQTLQSLQSQEIRVSTELQRLQRLVQEKQRAADDRSNEFYAMPMDDPSRRCMDSRNGIDWNCAERQQRDWRAQRRRAESRMESAQNELYSALDMVNRAALELESVQLQIRALRE